MNLRSDRKLITLPWHIHAFKQCMLLHWVVLCGRPWWCICFRLIMTCILTILWQEILNTYLVPLPIHSLCSWLHFIVTLPLVHEPCLYTLCIWANIGVWPKGKIFVFASTFFVDNCLNKLLQLATWGVAAHAPEPDLQLCNYHIKLNT